VSTSPSDMGTVAPLAAALRVVPSTVTLIPTPLHHNAPFLAASLTLLQGGHVVLMPRFDPTQVLGLVAQHRVTWMYAVPTIMSRIAKLPPDVLATRDFSSVQTLFHMAAPCPEWLKRWWIDLLGADAVWELYAGTEAQAVTLISGREWLEHPGSVGQVAMGEMVILDESGAPAAPGEIGEIWLRSAEPTYRYLGGTAREHDGWESLGDMGWMDSDGYLYLSDRKTDMVLVGGVNVYPAEIEAALDAHPAVSTSCVIGLPDDDLGSRLHAVVQLSHDVTDDELSAFLGDRLAPHKRPRTFERVAEPLRDEAGKVRRSAVRDARLTSAS
jgi:bile acid-coenzyme A ligase